MLTPAQITLVEKYRADWASDPATCKQFIESDLSEDDAKAVIKALSAPAGDSTQGSKPTPGVTTQPRPNDNIDLSAIDYNNLTGEAFDKYMALIGGLSGHESKDFTQYMASGVFKRELDLNAAEPTYVYTLIGIKINRPDPVNKTRIPVKMARDLNAQIMNRDNIASNSRYYLLTKY